MICAATQHSAPRSPASRLANPAKANPAKANPANKHHNVGRFPLFLRTWLICLTVYSVTSLLSTQASASKSRPLYSIVVGHNAPPAGRDDLPTLRYSDDDAARFFGLLSRASDHALLLVDMDDDTRRRHNGIARYAEAPTPAALKRAVIQVKNRVRQDVAAGLKPIVFFTYSGHGAQKDGETFLTLAGGSLSRSALMKKTLGAFTGAEVHLFIDACHAGALVSSRGGAFDKTVDVKTVALRRSGVDALLEDDGLKDLPQVGAFLAAAANAKAHEWTQVESGVFTHEVLSGLYGAADINGDLQIEYGELHAFLTAANSNVRDPRARPQVVVRSPDGNANAILLDLRALRDTRWLSGNAAPLGRFHVELENGERLLDAHVGPDMRIALALPRSSSAFVVSQRGEAKVSAKGPVHIHFDRLNHHRAEHESRGAVDLALRTQWFRTPFTRVYYMGFMDARGHPPTAFGPLSLLPGETTLAGDRAGHDSLYGLRVGLWTTAGHAVGLGIIGGVTALDAKIDYEDTQSQVDADAAAARYENAVTLGIIGGATAVTAGVVAWLLRPSPKKKQRSALQYDLQVGPVTSARIRW